MILTVACESETRDNDRRSEIIAKSSYLVQLLFLGSEWMSGLVLWFPVFLWSDESAAETLQYMMMKLSEYLP